MVKILLLLVLGLFPIKLFAQNSHYTVSYNKPISKDLEEIMELLDIDKTIVTIKGNFANKKLYFVEYNVWKDSISTTISPHTVDARGDSVFVMAILKYAPTSNNVRVNINLDYMVMKRNYPIDRANKYILMETKTSTDYDHEIPLIALTKGISQEVVINGKTEEVIDYCKLRDAKVHPKDWRNGFDIYPYVYFTLKVE